MNKLIKLIKTDNDIYKRFRLILGNKCDHLVDDLIKNRDNEIRIAMNCAEPCSKCVLRGK